MVLIMDELIEFILDLLLEGGIELSANKKVSKWIRYPIIAFLFLFFTIVIFGMIILGILMIEESILVSFIFVTCGIAMLIGSVIKFRKTYLEHKKIVERRKSNVFWNI